MANQFLSPEGDLENHFITESWLIDQYIGDQSWGWGRNTSSHLGDNTIISRSIPVTTFSGGSNWRQVSTGSDYTAGIKTDGTLWVWGGNSNAQLGVRVLGGTRPTPVTTFFGSNSWRQVSCGKFHTAVIVFSGQIWSFGLGASGQLGNTSAATRTIPVGTVPNLTWRQVSCGNDHTAGVAESGALYTWGSNTFCQLGNDQIFNRCTLVTTFAGGTNWKQVSCGGNHTTAVKYDGTLWVWGYNYHGQLGDNTSGINKKTPVTTFAGGTDWRLVSTGEDHTLAIKNGGTLWVWGRNNFGQLGTNTSGDSKSTPVTTFAGGTNWKRVSGGYQFTAAIKNDGTLWTWGSNSYGQLGTNTWSGDTKFTPVTTFIGGTNWKQVSCGDYHVEAVTLGIDI
jgi:alpha-tubulin suppressor-like RCC1 family protein